MIPICTEHFTVRNVDVILRQFREKAWGPTTRAVGPHFGRLLRKIQIRGAWDRPNPSASSP